MGSPLQLYSCVGAALEAHSSTRYSPGVCWPVSLQQKSRSRPLSAQRYVFADKGSVLAQCKVGNEFGSHEPSPVQAAAGQNTAYVQFLYRSRPCHRHLED